MKRTVLAAMIAFGGMQTTRAQNTAGSDSLLRYLQFEDPAPLSCLFTYFPPFFIQHGIELRSFIRSKTFRNIRTTFGDNRAVDAIFIRAMQLTNNNTAISLLLAALASFDHRLVGIKVPVFRIFLPLSDESEEEFTQRLRHLPCRLYPDGPQGPEGDRDKLQHFFGSAFLTFIFESDEAGDNFGEFIEHGEDAFIVGGVMDDRDRRANHEGQRFGIALLEENRRVPSEFMKPHYVGASIPYCNGVW